MNAPFARRLPPRIVHPQPGLNQIIMIPAARRLDHPLPEAAGVVRGQDGEKSTSFSNAYRMAICRTQASHHAVPHQ